MIDTHKNSEKKITYLWHIFQAQEMVHKIKAPAAKLNNLSWVLNPCRREERTGRGGGRGRSRGGRRSGDEVKRKPSMWMHRKDKTHGLERPALWDARHRERNGANFTLVQKHRTVGGFWEILICLQRWRLDLGPWACWSIFPVFLNCVD